MVELKYVEISPEDSPDSVKRRRTKQGSQKWVPNNIAEYFFFDEYGFLSINEKKIKDCYTEFTQAMNMVYANMRKIYNELAGVALTADDIRKSGNDFKKEILAEIESKGLEYFITKEK